MANMDMDEERQASEWESLYDQLVATLSLFGKDDPFGEGDFWVLDDNYGHPQQKIYFWNLEMLNPRIISAIQSVLEKFAEWDVVVSIDVPSANGAWPNMGLIIRRHEIIDGLQRQYFPSAYQNIEYEGSRRGTDRD